MSAWCWSFWLHNWRERWGRVGDGGRFCEAKGVPRSLHCAARRAKRRRGRKESGRSGRDDSAWHGGGWVSRGRIAVGRDVVVRRTYCPPCHPERRAGGFCRAGVEGSGHGVPSLRTDLGEAALLFVAPGKSALRSRNVGLKARMSASFLSRRQFLSCFSLLMAARTSVKGSK